MYTLLGCFTQYVSKGLLGLVQLRQVCIRLANRTSISTRDGVVVKVTHGETVHFSLVGVSNSLTASIAFSCFALQPGLGLILFPGLARTLP